MKNAVLYTIVIVPTVVLLGVITTLYFVLNTSSNTTLTLSSDHLTRTTNPHTVTADQVGVGHMTGNYSATRAPTDNDVKPKGAFWVTTADGYVSQEPGWLKITNGADVTAHISETNPHSITKTTLGLSKVADLNSYSSFTGLQDNTDFNNTDVANNDVQVAEIMVEQRLATTTYPGSYGRICLAANAGAARWPELFADHMEIFNVGNADMVAANVIIHGNTSANFSWFSFGPVPSTNYSLASDRFTMVSNTNSVVYAFFGTGYDAKFRFTEIFGELGANAGLWLEQVGGDTQFQFAVFANTYTLGIDETNGDMVLARSNTLGTNNVFQLNANAMTFTGNVSADDVYSDVYTPTSNNEAGFSSVTTYPTTYVRRGNVVSFNTLLSVDYDGNTNFFMELDLPVASNFTSASDLTAVVQQNTFVSFDRLQVDANVTNDSLNFVYNLSANAVLASDDLYLAVEYLVK